MWLSLAFLSAALLGLYDVAKKYSLRENAVIPVLFCNTLFCALIFLPFIVASHTGILGSESLLCVDNWQWQEQRFIVLKSFIVLSSWILCHQTSSDHYRRSGQRHPSRADSARRAYYLRRAS